MLNSCCAIAADLLESFAAPYQVEKILRHLATNLHASMFFAENPRALGHLSQQIFQQILWPCILAGSDSHSFRHIPMLLVATVQHPSHRNIENVHKLKSTASLEEKKLYIHVRARPVLRASTPSALQSQHVSECVYILQL